METEKSTLLEGNALASELRRTRKLTASEVTKETASAEDPECKDATS